MNGNDRVGGQAGLVIKAVFYSGHEETVKIVD